MSEKPRCKRCKGAGRVPIDGDWNPRTGKCPDCDGTGRCEAAPPQPSCPRCAANEVCITHPDKWMKPSDPPLVTYNESSPGVPRPEPTFVRLNPAPSASAEPSKPNPIDPARPWTVPDNSPPKVGQEREEEEAERADWRELPTGAWFVLESPNYLEKYSVQERTSGGCSIVCSTPYWSEKAKRDMHEIADAHNAGRAALRASQKQANKEINEAFDRTYGASGKEGA